MKTLPVHNPETFKEETFEIKIFSYPTFPTNEYIAQESQQWEKTTLELYCR